MKPYLEFLSATQVPWVRLDADDLFERRYAFLRGIVTEVRYKRVGDYHTGEEPDEEEKERRRWGAMFAYVHIEDVSGRTIRAKVDVDLLDRYKAILDKGEGTPIAIHATLEKRYESIRANLVIDLSAARIRRKSGEALVGFDGVLFRDSHPVAKFSKKDLSRLGSNDERRVTAIGMLTHVTRKLDREGRQMSFFGLLGYRGFVEAVCFASSQYEFNRAKLEPGDVVKVRLVRGERSFLFDAERGSKVSVLKRQRDASERSS